MNWNSLSYTCECLASIFSEPDAHDLEVIVVDNASNRDETLPIKSRFPSVITVRSHQNLGFSGANNLGFEQSSGEHLLFLNPDTKVIAPAIRTMSKHLQATLGAGIMGCKLLNTDGSVQTSCIQRFPTILNQCMDLDFLRSRHPLWKIWGIAPLFSEAKEPAAVEVVSGACLMMKRDLFERVGKFSEKYFMYAEDVDLCYRAAQSGWKAYYTGEATVVHHGGGTSKGRRGDAWIAVMQRRAILTFCRVAHGRLYAAGYRLAMGINAGCRLLLLAAFSPIRYLATQGSPLYTSMSKWLGVLKWSIGLDRPTVGLQGRV